MPGPAVHDTQKLSSRHNTQNLYKFDKNVDWVYRSLEFDNTILRESDPVTVRARIILRWPYQVADAGGIYI